MTFYVSNLSTTTTREHLLEAFRKHGEVANVMIPGEKMKNGVASGANRGYGFVVMDDKVQGHAAMAALDKQALQGQAMSVQVAKEAFHPTYPS